MTEACAGIQTHAWQTSTEYVSGARTTAPYRLQCAFEINRSIELSIRSMFSLSSNKKLYEDCKGRFCHVLSCMFDITLLQFILKLATLVLHHVSLRTVLSKMNDIYSPTGTPHTFTCLRLNCQCSYLSSAFEEK